MDSTLSRGVLRGGPAWATVRGAGETVLPPVIPGDLREWAGADTISGWIESALRELNWDHPQVRDYLDANPGFRPKGWLRLLAFSYVTGLYSSQEIANLCRKDGSTAALCEGERPFSGELIHFRRAHRRLLEHVIARVYEQATQAASGRWPEMGPACLESLRQRARQRLDIARHLDAPDE